MSNIVAVVAVIAAAAVIVYDRLRLKRTMDRLDQMLEDAIAGNFSERVFDESRLSAVETRFARYLAACDVSSKNLGTEKARIQAMIADISHQTKTPVANILLYASLLDEKQLPDDCRDCVAALSAQAEKLRFLIESLVKAGRLETGVIAVQARQAPVAPLVEAAAAQARAKAAAKGVALVCEGTAASARFDPKWTQEALFNLVDNAVKYTPAGGTVRLSVMPYELFCRIDVADTGIGVAEDELAHIFERFYRSPTLRDAEGVGLGLYLAREIAAAGGGYIKACSTPGKGSTFSLFLSRG